VICEAEGIVCCLDVSHLAIWLFNKGTKRWKRRNSTPTTSWQHRRSIYEIGYLLTRLTVGEIMTYFPVTIGADRLVAEAVKRMLAYKIGALPVVEKGKLIGILTRTNLLQAFLQAQTALPVAA
jgi:hypothetical protein